MPVLKNAKQLLNRQVERNRLFVWEIYSIIIRILLIMANDVLNIFSSFQNYLKEEQKLRDDMKDIVRVLEQTAHELITVLQAIHQDGSDSGIKTCCEKSRLIIEKSVKLEFKKLDDILSGLPTNQYYKYHDLWKFATQKLVFAVSLIVFLESGKLISHEGVAEILNVTPERHAGFHLEVVDYLMGVLDLASELSRFAVNSVTYGDFKRPIQISKFVTELNAGFTLLKLKNDYLRKRFDGLKYDVQKIEAVVYDLYVRKLVQD